MHQHLNEKTLHLKPFFSIRTRSQLQIFQCILYHRKILNPNSYQLFNWPRLDQLTHYRIFLPRQVTTFSSFAKISQLISWRNYFRTYLNLKLGYFFGVPCTCHVWVKYITHILCFFLCVFMWQKTSSLDVTCQLAHYISINVLQNSSESHTKGYRLIRVSRFTLIMNTALWDVTISSL